MRSTLSRSVVILIGSAALLPILLAGDGTLRWRSPRVLGASAGRAGVIKFGRLLRLPTPAWPPCTSVYWTSDALPRASRIVLPRLFQTIVLRSTGALLIVLYRPAPRIAWLPVIVTCVSRELLALL